MPEEPIIDVREVSRRFGPVCALDAISLRVSAGEIFGLIGSDGAGKTTLMRILATVLAPSAGSASVAGFDVGRRAQEIKPLIGYMPQQFGFYGDLTVWENLQFFADIYGIPKAEQPARFERFLSFSGLLPFRKRLAGNLSGGMKQKLGLAAVLIHMPQILLLDEPTNGVDPVSRQEFWEILQQMHEQGLTVFVSTAYLDEAEYCQRIALMHDGRVLEINRPAELYAGFSSLEDAVIHRLGPPSEERHARP